MEHQLWKAIVVILTGLDKRRKSTAFDFSDEDIVKVYYWSVIHDRPTCWACSSKHWPIYLRKRSLPSPTTMSRRLRSPSVVALLNALESRVVAPKQPGLFWTIDGKPLTIGGCSKDRQAGYGRAAGCKAKGYKIHAIVGPSGSIASWRLAPMNKDERVMAARMLRTAPIQGYVVADRKDRNEIERRFGQLTNWGGGLSCLPAWVRTHRRVRRWVQAKLVLTALKRSNLTRTYVT